MDEAEWLDCTDLTGMLEHVRHCGGLSDRRLRLFACGCLRRVWSWLTDERSRAAVEAAERYADGLATGEELSAARDAAAAAGQEEVQRLFGPVHREHVDQTLPHDLAEATTRPSAENAAVETAVSLTRVALEMREVAALGKESGEGWASALEAEAVAAGPAGQAALLRDVTGNLFRVKMSIDAAVLVRNDGRVVRIAEAIYEQRRYSDLPILADALEDAGCGESVLLEHLRGPGPHIRGCWVIDLLLSKE